MSRNHERTVYVSPEVTPGSHLTYGDWRDTPGEHAWYADRYEGPGNPLGRFVAHGVPLTLIEYAVGSDYSGNLCERSNADVLKKRFSWLVTLSGGHGTFGVAYLGKRENQNPALLEAIDDLESYPLADEDHHSNLEMKISDQAWEDDGRSDWKRALERYFNALEIECPDCNPDNYTCNTCGDDGVVTWEHDLDVIPDLDLDVLYDDCCERFRGGERYLNEQGDSIYFPINDIIKRFADVRYADTLHKPSLASIEIKSRT